jgi:hypothetical protein
MIMLLNTRQRWYEWQYNIDHGKVGSTAIELL